MKENKNYGGFLALYIVIAVVLGLLVFVSVVNMTGNATLWGTLISPAPTLGNQTKCFDTDGGQNFFVKGYTWNKQANHTDVCLSYNQLEEGYCANNGNDIKVNITSCSLYGDVCIDGACRTNQSNQTAYPIKPGYAQSNMTNCTDTDGGIMPYVFGIVNPGNYKDFCWFNGTNATNSSVVAEFYCWNNMPQRTLIYCPYGCSWPGQCNNETNAVAMGMSVGEDTSPGADLQSSVSSGSCGGSVSAVSPIPAGATLVSQTANSQTWQYYDPGMKVYSNVAIICNCGSSGACSINTKGNCLTNTCTGSCSKNVYVYGSNPGNAPNVGQVVGMKYIFGKGEEGKITDNGQTMEIIDPITQNVKSEWTCSCNAWEGACAWVGDECTPNSKCPACRIEAKTASEQ